MTLRASKDVGFLLVGGRDVLGVVTSLSDTEEAIVEETTALGAADDTWAYVGLTKWSLDQDGFYDDGAGSGNEAAELSGAQVLMYAIEGNTIGLEHLGVSAVRTIYTRGPARDQMHKAQVQYRAAAGPERGQVSAPLATRTTIGPADTASDNWGAGNAPSTGGAVGYLAVTALDLDGGTALQVTIRDSDDDITFADLIAFTAVAAAPAAERKTVAGDVERYTLTRWEFTGTPGGSQTSRFATGLARL